jgi:hypothetical protein
MEYVPSMGMGVGSGCIPWGIVAGVFLLFPGIGKGFLCFCGKNWELKCELKQGGNYPTLFGFRNL